jgi:hypothetical protein
MGPAFLVTPYGKNVPVCNMPPNPINGSDEQKRLKKIILLLY